MSKNFREVDLKRLGGLFFFIVVIVSISWGCWAIYQRLSNSRLMPMTEILISGKRQYVEDADLQRALANVPKSGNFFTLDVNKVQQALVALPWVQQASVRKQWPNKLRVFLQEQEPVAHWNNAALLNTQGVIFDAPQTRLQEPLVSLHGPDDEAPKVLENWQQMQQIVAGLKLTIRSVTLNERDSWVVTLSNGIELRLVQKDRMERLQRFVKLYNQLHPEKMAYADLRYNNGLAIGWKKQQDSTENDQNNR
ncbi:cell division protein FtsQ/DivIB [Celerinatantimonas sp. YJH-8]|uniref:cell division protein FtsQ/DivIB n=1 Tax=Celerinatantimonas sp. YJH-8 TaxID=3228714 RepID=UPI0038C5E35B